LPFAEIYVIMKYHARYPGAANLLKTQGKKTLFLSKLTVAFCLEVCEDDYSEKTEESSNVEVGKSFRGFLQGNQYCF